MNTHRNVTFTAQVYRDRVHAGRDGAIFGIAPLFHITGLIGHIAVSMLVPAPLILAYRFEPQVVLDALLEHRPAFTIGAITAFSALLNAPGFTRDHFASFTSVYSGGAPISPTAEKAFLTATGIQVHNAYGLTETTSPDDPDAVRLAVTGGPDVGGVVGRRARCPTRSSGSRATTARTCRWARPARSSPTGRRWSPGTGRSRTRRRRTCPVGR